MLDGLETETCRYYMGKSRVAALSIIIFRPSLATKFYETEVYQYHGILVLGKAIL
jgi:hypothetical protein